MWLGIFEDMLGEAAYLKRFAMKLTRNADSADDLFQDTFVRALRFIGNFEQGTSLRSWMYRIMQNIYLEKMKARKVAVEFDSGKVESSEFLSKNPKNDQEWRDKLQHVLWLMDSLPPAQKDAIMLAAYGMDVEEAAEKLGVTVSTYKSQKSRGQKQLREWWD